MQRNSTTPFGRRLLTLAMVASQATAKSRPPEKFTHKWNVFRAICAARACLGVSERALAVLDALLTFYPETVLGGEDLVVFPSNRQLSLHAPMAWRRRRSGVTSWLALSSMRVDGGENPRIDGAVAADAA